MPRISIYVSDEMKARMDDLGVAANWSALAQTAFRTELDHLETLKEVKSMKDVRDRLRASKQKFQAAAGADGRGKGAEWAKKYAEFNELRLMANVDDVGFDMLSGIDAAALVYSLVKESEDFDEMDLAGLFLMGEDDLVYISPQYVEGFVLGAQDVWAELEDEI